MRISGAEKDDGGGMYLYSSNPTLTNVTIANNTANYGAGGMYLEISQPTLSNVTIANNVSTSSGGGMMVVGSPIYVFSNLTLTHVTITGNSAGEGASI